MKKTKLSIYLLLFLFLTSSVWPRSEEVTEIFYIEGADELILLGNLGVGEFRIIPKDMDETAIFEIVYSPRHFEYHIDSKIRRGKSYIDFESDCLNKIVHDNDDNDWDIYLSTQYPISLDMDIGACEAEFDLGGLQLRSLYLDIGATSGFIDFSKANPIRAEEINIDAGASSLEITHIGNANFEEFSLDGGAGSFDLDFRGKYAGESLIDIDIGLGSADIILPRGVPVRIETESDGWFSSVDIHNRDLDEVDDDVYESEDFDSSDNRIILSIDVGMGSIDIRWK